ncbi:hypothetical protein KW782_02555 [Candidatus Parcubacteria bacterium]|nr:hypothetical protein [Candidatus Parcubacteria bacterium]
MGKYVLRGLLISFIIPIGIFVYFLIMSFSAANYETEGYTLWAGILLAGYSLGVSIPLGILGGLLYGSTKG